MSLLEVVLAVVLATLVTATAVTAIGMGERAQARARARLSAYELAHRLILQYLDDPELMESESVPLRYGRDVFRYEMDLSIARQRLSENASTNQNANDRFRALTIRVFATDEGSQYFTKREELAQITRIFEPVFRRNPDTIAMWDDNPDKVIKMIEDVYIKDPTLTSPPGDGGGSPGGGGGR